MLRPAGLDRALERFDEALARLAEARPFAKSRYQGEVFTIATELMDSDAGMAALYDRAHLFDGAGVFHEGGWADPEKLLPHLVSFGLRGQGIYPIVEILSELRMLAIARGRYDSPVDAESAESFLLKVVGHNLDLLVAEPTEETRMRPAAYERAHRLFALLESELTLRGLGVELVAEIRMLAAQRPIQVSRMRSMILHVGDIVDGGELDSVRGDLEPYLRAAHGRSLLSPSGNVEPRVYRELLSKASTDALREEASCLAEALRSTGITHPNHAVLLRTLTRKEPSLVGDALGLNDVGRAELSQNEEFALQLIRLAVYPETVDSIYGLAQVLERSLLSRPTVAGGLRRLVDLAIEPTARRSLVSREARDAGLSANAILLAGALSVLGQPLGVGQGQSPTCQAARGISLWAQHAPNMLLDLIVSAARDGVVELDFEGLRIASNQIEGGVAGGVFDDTLDPVSMVLVPHLDRLYDELMRRASLRGEDPHRWVNPALYGRWVQAGFVSAIDVITGRVTGYAGFIRKFFATHHSSYNDGNDLVYPNPVGILVTDVHGSLLGPHAVSLQRIDRSPDGELRAYFFNPNNEGRQDWGFGVKPTVSGEGERHGESSLPFAAFASRLYAYHYNPYEEGDGYAVPAEEVAAVEEMARKSWGRSYAWTE